MLIACLNNEFVSGVTAPGIISLKKYIFVKKKKTASSIYDIFVYSCDERHCFNCKE